MVGTPQVGHADLMTRRSPEPSGTPTTASLRAEIEAWFSRRGVPQLISDYTTERRMDARAVHLCNNGYPLPMQYTVIIEAVAADRDIAGEADARGAVVAVMEGFERFLPPAAVVALGSATNIEMVPTAERAERTVGAFFEWLADRRQIDQAAAATQARVVAEALASRMGADVLHGLADVVPDDFLALFEQHRRGELTEPDGSTRGARTIDAPDYGGRQEGDRGSSDTRPGSMSVPSERTTDARAKPR